MSESHFRNTDEILFDNEAKTYDLIESMFPIMKELYVLASQQLAQHVQVGMPGQVHFAKSPLPQQAFNCVVF